MNRFYLGVCLVILSAAGFGVMPIFALYAYQAGVNVATLLFLRFALAACVFFLYIFGRFKMIKITRSHLISLLILGGVLYPLQASFYFSAVKYIPASLAVLLLYTYPIFVTGFSLVFDKEKLTKQVLASIVFCFLGLALVLGTSFGAINFFGAFLALAAAIVYSCYITLGNRVVKQFLPVATSAFIVLFASLSLLVTGFFTGAIDFHFQAGAWLPIGGLALFSTVFSIFTFFRGLELIGSTRAAILSMTEPLVTIAFSALLFSERLTLPQILGGIAVLSGAVLIVSTQGEKSRVFEQS